MAQIRRPPRYRSPPARQIPSLPNPIRFRPPTQNTDQSSIRTIPPQNGVSHDKQYDPPTVPMIAIKNPEQSTLSLNSSTIPLTVRERQQPVSVNNNILICIINRFLF
jgi:hypothetical protein